MAKPQSSKQPSKSSEVAEVAKTAQEQSSKSEAATPTASASTAAPPKKEVARPKKQAATKNGSLLPSAYKLEQLKAAVTAAGNTENLLLILHHVEEAGGKAEVTESIEAYRMLKTVLEE